MRGGILKTFGCMLDHPEHHFCSALNNHHRFWIIHYAKKGVNSWNSLREPHCTITLPVWWIMKNDWIRLIQICLLWFTYCSAPLKVPLAVLLISAILLNLTTMTSIQKPAFQGSQMHKLFSSQKTHFYLASFLMPKKRKKCNPPLTRFFACLLPVISQETYLLGYMYTYGNKNSLRCHSHRMCFLCDWKH